MENQDANYFNSYDDLKVHELMLRDEPRNEAYRQAIHDNASRFKGRIVLDVGAGTGILSVFCAQVGAAKVYAVEASAIAAIAEEVVKENGFEDVIQVINKRIEDVTLPTKVDIIVSEWMGFYLLHEAMLDSVLDARDRLLSPSGLLFPTAAALFCAPCRLPALHAAWDSVSGVRMQAVGARLRAALAPLAVPAGDLLAEPEAVAWLELGTVRAHELRRFEARHVAAAARAGRFEGVCMWFACTFPAGEGGAEAVVLSTAPGERETHWRQAVAVLGEGREVEEGAPVAYRLVVERAADGGRRYDVHLELEDAETVEHPEYCRCYMTKCILVRAMLDKYEKDAMQQ